jgi:hypothetical protein
MFGVFGIVVLAATWAGLWYSLPTNGVQIAYLRNPTVDTYFPILFIIGIALGGGLLTSTLVGWF